MVEAANPRPTDKRVWASVEKSGRAVICEAFEEALRRDPEQKRRWVVLVDGEPKQLRAVKAALRALRASKDFDAYWKLHLEQDALRNHASRYQDAEIPDPMPPPKPRIKRVKQPLSQPFRSTE